MNFRYEIIGLERINFEDIRFKITSRAVSESQLTSIKEAGLVNPPVLLEGSGFYHIVSGFNRIDACRQLGMAEIPVRILDAGTDRLHCIQIAIVDNASQRSMDLIEQARSVELLASCYGETEQLVDAAKSLGIAINAEIAGKLRVLIKMNEVLQSGVADGAIALPVALQLQEMNDEGSCKVLAAFLVELGLSLNRQREILDWVTSICRRDKLTPAQLLSSGNIQIIRQDGNIDRRQKGRFIRDELRKRRYPAITRHEQHFTRLAQRLNLPKGVQLNAPQHFESPVYELKFNFQNRRQLLKRAQELQRLAESEKLDGLWENFMAD